MTRRSGGFAAIALTAALVAGCATPKRFAARAPSTRPATAATKPVDRADLALDDIEPRPSLPAPATAPTVQPTTQRAPLDAVALFAQARDEMLAGNRYTAIKLLERAIIIDPNSYELHFQLGQANTGPGMGYDGAIAAYTNAAAIDPRRLAVQFELGRLSLAKGNYPGAIERLRLAMQTPEYADDDSSAALVDFFLARALQQGGYDRAALDTYATLIGRLQTGGLSTRGVPELAYLVNQPENLFAQVAELCQKRGLYADAIRLFTLAADRKPKDFPAHANVVKALVAAGRHKEAAERSAVLVQQFDATPPSLTLMKETHRRFGGDEAVIRELQRLHRDRPDDRSLLYALADALTDAKRSSEAQALLSDAVRKMRYPPELVRRLFKLYDSSNDVTAAARLIIETLAVRQDASRELMPLWSELLRPWRKNHLNVTRLQAVEVRTQAEASKQFWISQIARA